MTVIKKFLKNDATADFFCCIFFSLANVSNYLLYNAYPLFSWESATLTAAFSLWLLFAGLLLKTIRASWLFYVILICLFFDLHYGFANRPLWEYCRLPRWGSFSRDLLAGSAEYSTLIWILNWFSSQIRHTAMLNHVLAGALAGAMVGRFQKSMPGFLTRAFALLFFTTLIRFTISPEPLFRTSDGPKAAMIQTTVPADIFIFFVDEHTGIEGIPRLKGAGKVWKKILTDHYQQRGFTLFPRAYSNYFDTHNSIPSILNHKLLDKNRYTENVPKNGLLEFLLQKGRPLNIYQSDILDFCGAFRGREAHCFQYRANSAGNIAYLPLSHLEKILFLADSFVEAHQSELLKRIYRWTMHKAGREVRSHTGPIPVMRVFEQLKNDVQTSPPGTVFFAHLLMPHYPYVYDADCRLKHLKDWENRSSANEGNTRADWKKRYGKYADQSICLDRKLEDFFKVLDAEQRYENASIVIFSDHGSRITLAPPVAESVGSFILEDWMACFSAFAAVKKGRFLESTPLLKNPVYKKRIPLAALMNTLFRFSPEDAALEKRFSRVYLRESYTSGSFSDYELPEATHVVFPVPRGPKRKKE